MSRSFGSASSKHCADSSLNTAARHKLLLGKEHGTKGPFVFSFLYLFGWLLFVKESIDLTMPQLTINSIDYPHVFKI